MEKANPLVLVQGEDDEEVTQDAVPVSEADSEEVERVEIEYGFGVIKIKGGGYSLIQIQEWPVPQMFETYRMLSEMAVAVMSSFMEKNSNKD